MRLKKEFILIIGILSFIIILEIITNRITDKNIQEIRDEIENINEEIMLINDLKEKDNYEEYKEQLEKDLKRLKDNWFEKQDELSFFSEHNELEKVSKCLIVLEENTKNEEFTIALSDGVELIYWLDHLRQKDKLELKNLF